MNQESSQRCQPVELRGVLSAWVVVAITLYIFALVPTGRPLWLAFRELGKASPDFFPFLKGVISGALIAVFIGYLGYIILATLRHYRAAFFNFFCVMGILCAVWTFNLRPEEWMHILNFSVLAIFSERAFHNGSRGFSPHSCAFLVGIMVSLFDECLQWLCPGRFFDMRDLAINFYGTLLGLWLPARNRSTWTKQ